jgi:hypothetical protein
MKELEILLTFVNMAVGIPASLFGDYSLTGTVATIIISAFVALLAWKTANH